jgi:hypothetical protein
MTGLTDVSANPLNVIVQLYPAEFSAGATQNSQYVQTTANLLNALPSLPASLQAQFNSIVQYLQTPMGNLFNTAWAGQQAAVVNYAASQFQSAAASGGVTVDNATCYLPPSGTVLAGVDPAGTNPAGLIIDFHLPGGDFHFATPKTIHVWFITETLMPAWRLTFDADVSVFTSVPVLPFNLVPSAQATLSNASMQPANALAATLSVLDNFFTALGNFFTQGNYISDVNWDTQLAQQQADQTLPLPTSVVGSMLSLFNDLNQAGPECVTYGFTECAFSIVGSTLTLTVTHPLDPGPTMADAYNLPGTFAPQAQLSTNVPSATPGSTITALGTGFPPDTSTSLSLEFLNTSSGTPSQAQVQFNGQIYNVSVPTGSSTNPLYTYNPTGLTPGATYVFQARCGDQLTWSQWGPTFALATAPSSNVELVLATTGGPGLTSTPIGNAPLPPAPTITWTCPGTVPPDTPVGLYELQAWLGGLLGGTLIASTPFSIEATAGPQIAIIDPTTGAIDTDTSFYSGGVPFTLAGWGFPDGTVTISFNGTPQATATSSDGSTPNFTALLTTPGLIGTVNVTAAAGGVTAPPLPIYMVLTQ